MMFVKLFVKFDYVQTFSSSIFLYVNHNAVRISITVAVLNVYLITGVLTKFINNLQFNYISRKFPLLLLAV